MLSLSWVKSFRNILMTWGIIRLFQMFLLASWKWQIALCDLHLWIYIYALEYDHGTYAFGPTPPCPIVEVIAIWERFLELFVYCTVTKCAFTFRTLNVFGCFCNVMVQLELVNHNFPNKTRSICAAFKSLTEGSYAQRVSAQTTTILSTMAGT